MINYIILKNEIARDPQDFGYVTMTPEEVVAILNKKQFNQTKIVSDTNLLNVGPTVPIPTEGTATTISKMSVIGLNVITQEKKSRAELLFGDGTVVTLEDINLTLTS
jgi:hypothetical protein